MQNFVTMDLEGWAASSWALLGPAEAGRARLAGAIDDPQLERGARAFVDSLDRHGRRATFFVDAAILPRHGGLVREIGARGHEIASHALRHAPFETLGRSAMREELRDSRGRLEDLLGAEVIGFRAPHLLRRGAPAGFFEELLAAGYRYDSSLTSEWARRTLGAGDAPFPVPGATELFEYPVSSHSLPLGACTLGGTRLALVSRVRLLRWAGAANAAGSPVVLYAHPYELDRGPLRWRHPRPSPRARLAAATRALLRRGRAAMIEAVLAELPCSTIAADLRARAG